MPVLDSTKGVHAAADKRVRPLRELVSRATTEAKAKIPIGKLTSVLSNHGSPDAIVDAALLHLEAVLNGNAETLRVSQTKSTRGVSKIIYDTLIDGAEASGCIPSKVK